MHREREIVGRGSGVRRTRARDTGWQEWGALSELSAPVRGWEEATSTLHEERLDAVMVHLRRSGAESVVDLGCGAGALLRRLVAEPQLRRIAGVDNSLRALEVAQQLLASEDGALDARLTLRHASLTGLHADLVGFDAVALVETIEHLEPAHLGKLERSVFARMRPCLVVITTPNSEYNTLHGIPHGELRHADHRFEWDRRRFGEWAAGVGRRNGYGVVLDGVGPGNAWFGCSTQIAVFERTS